MASTYNVSPTPTAGNGAFGLVPGQTALPPSLWEQLNQNVPNYGALTTSATGDMSSMLAGTLSPSTQSNIWNTAASRGVALGQPNSPIGNEIGMNLTGTTTEGLQQQGLQDYNTFTGTTGGLQESPALMSEISQSNAVLGSAPSPQSAADYAKSLFDQYMQQSNPAGYSMNIPSNPYSQFPMFQSPSTGTGTQQASPGQGGFGSTNNNPYQVFNTGGYGVDSNIDFGAY